MTVKKAFEEYFEKYHRGFIDFHKIHMQVAYTAGDKNGRKRTLEELRDMFQDELDDYQIIENIAEYIWAELGKLE